ncbi:hypothetical protein JCM6882_005401 [Rhodosporidiobolus microsporus]
MLPNAGALDTLVREATVDPYTTLPRLVVLACSSSSPTLYAGSSGWASLPDSPCSAEELAAAAARGEATPIEEGSVFEAFSCTKLVAAIAGMQLLEAGEIELDAPVRRWLPEKMGEVKKFEGFDERGEVVLGEVETEVTARMLFTHTSGFCYHWYHPDVAAVAEKLGVGILPNGEGGTRDWLTKMPLFDDPGAGFYYGTSSDWLTLLVEKVSGMGIEEYFQERIFRPLGISDATFLPNPNTISMALAPSLSPSGAALSPSSPFTFRPPLPLSTAWHGGGLGLSISPRSYLTILRALLRGGQGDGVGEENKLFQRAETAKLLWTPHLTTEAQRAGLRTFGVRNMDPFSRRRGGFGPDEGVDFGLGGFLYGREEGGRLPGTGRGLGSLSWSGMTNTYWVLDPEKDFAFLVWTNLLPFGHEHIFAAWEEVEVELYKGLEALRASGGEGEGNK